MSQALPQQPILEARAPQMIARRAVLHADSFPYGFAGPPWVVHEWLTEVLAAVSFRDGVAVVHAAAC